MKHGELPVAEGQKIILQFADAAEDGKPAPIARISAYSDEQLKATIAIDDHGAYVPVTLRRSAAVAKRASSNPDEGGMSLYESLYETALKQGLPRPVIDEMVRAFANDVDFQRSVQPATPWLDLSPTPTRSTRIRCCSTPRSRSAISCSNTIAFRRPTTIWSIITTKTADPPASS